ncbi:MAG: amidohydrolase, partial [Spirochaetes bacterium]|nr:amidohydrolase [Spirochaetota bacterium]
MEQKNVDLIIENGTLVTMDNNHRILKNHSVAVKGTYIDAIDTAAEIRKRYQSKETIDASKMVVMPGLVDTYGHAGHGMIKGIYHPDHGW